MSRGSWVVSHRSGVGACGGSGVGACGGSWFVGSWLVSRRLWVVGSWVVGSWLVGLGLWLVARGWFLLARAQDGTQRQPTARSGRRPKPPALRPPRPSP